MRAVIIHRLNEGNDWLSQNLSDLQKAIERSRESSRALILVKQFNYLEGQNCITHHLGHLD